MKNVKSGVFLRTPSSRWVLELGPEVTPIGLLNRSTQQSQDSTFQIFLLTPRSGLHGYVAYAQFLCVILFYCPYLEILNTFWTWIL